VQVYFVYLPITFCGFVSGCEALACVSGSLHKTAVISWLRLIERKLNLKREQKEFEKRSDGNK